ncbi:hypothetical protein [Paenibacillus sp. NPDC055715]
MEVSSGLFRMRLTADNIIFMHRAFALGPELRDFGEAVSAGHLGIRRVHEYRNVICNLKGRENIEEEQMCKRRVPFRRFLFKAKGKRHLRNRREERLKPEDQQAQDSV